MVCHEVFALISENEVKNVIVGDFYNCNEIARMDYGNEAFAVEVTQIPVQAGDIYENGLFKRGIEGKKVIIDPIPTDRQEIDALIEENKSLTESLNNVELAIVDLYESGDKE